MDMSKDAVRILGDAVEYASDNSYEYVTPEVILLMLLSDYAFRSAFEEAGASGLGKSSIGFQSTVNDSSVITQAVKNTFQPEFRNRLNKIVVFNSMSDEMADRIIERKMGELAAQLKGKGIDFSAEPAANELIRKKGVSREFGARELDRVIRNEVKPLFVDEILFGKLKNGGRLILSADENTFSIKIKKNRGVKGGNICS